MDEIYKVVCSYKKVADHLETHPADKVKIHSFIDEIRGDYSDNVLNGMSSFMDKTFVKLYDGFNVQTPDGFDLKELLKKNHVVLCPNHQSHADYLALQYIFFKQFKIPVYIAAGNNLNIFPIGKIFKKCGAFFIRRRFNNGLYKIAFQGYIYYLLKTDKVVEFFFEGGRTRTGKLLPPKYGLFSMILDAHSQFGEEKKPLMFIPVSIAHEHVPEEGAHAKELSGAKKEKEKASQLLKLFTLFNKKLGTIHIRFSEGIVVDEEIVNLKTKTQDLAFECFRSVGKQMPITPSSLLSLILLDDPGGALTWKQIVSRVDEVITYCKFAKIPMTDSLDEEHVLSSIRIAMDMFINNKKVELLKRTKLNQVYYKITEPSRVNLLFHKNMILHHFFVPTVMNATWFNILGGKIKTEFELKKFLLEKRKELKYEFYLPRPAEMLEEGFRLIEFAIGRKLTHVSEITSLTEQELYLIGKKVIRFSSALSYIYEAYYISAITVKYLSDEPFSEEKFLQVAQELFEMEREHGRIIKYSESFTIPKIKSTLVYFIHLNLIKKDDQGNYTIVNMKRVGITIEKFARDINDQISSSLKILGENE